MLTFKSLTTNGVDLYKKMLTSVLTFKSLVINDVDFVDLYTRYIHPKPSPVAATVSPVFADMPCI